MKKFIKWFSKSWAASYTHRIVTFLMINSVAWVWCSYYLAYIGKEDIAETLSKAVVTEVIAVIVVYCLKAFGENISKNTDWPAKNKSEPSDSSENY
jgi:ABC-type transport system involved in cytochrome bd biosynthesis fused ATPase/permease subunit